LRFDAKGNEHAVAALKSAQKKDHLRVTVTGVRDGDTIKVTSLKM
jgi:endonuclease YncB( thermonuclease family)